MLIGVLVVTVVTAVRFPTLFEATSEHGAPMVPSWAWWSVDLVTWLTPRGGALVMATLTVFAWFAWYMTRRAVRLEFGRGGT